MALFGRKAADPSRGGRAPRFAEHPVFGLTAGMSQAAVVDRIGYATETKTSAEVIAEFAGPDAIIDPARAEPEEYWSYENVPDGDNLGVQFREQRLVEVLVRKNGTNDIVARIDDRGVAASSHYRLALRAHRL